MKKFDKFLIQPVKQMIFPALKSFSEDKNILKQKIMLAHSFIGFFSIPIYTYIFFFAEEFILSLYGDKWFNSVIPMMILVPLFLRSSLKGQQILYS